LFFTQSLSKIKIQQGLLDRLLSTPKTITYSVVPTLKERKLKNKALSYGEKNFLGHLELSFLDRFALSPTARKEI